MQVLTNLCVCAQVYDLPTSLSLSPEQVSQCRWSAYSSELLLHTLLASPSSPVASSLVTTDPALADVFFIPLFPACFLFDCWVKAGWNRTQRCDVDASYILPVMDWVKAQGHWDAHGGADHLIAHPMDFADAYYEEETRAAMNASMYLVTVGDLRPPPYSVHYRSHRDIVIPSATHLLHSYYLNPMDYLDASGHPLTTPRGAADPSRVSAVVPTAVDIFDPTPAPSFSASSWRSFRWSRGPLTTTRRSTTAIFRGGVGEPTDGEAYALGIRTLFFPAASGAHEGFSSLPGWDIALSSPNEEYARALSRAKYGLVPPGYTLDTTRLYEYLAFGVVPVFLGAGPIAGQVMPFAEDFDWGAFSISVGRDRVHELPSVLEGVGEEEYERLRRGVWEVGRLVMLEGRRGNVWKWIARALCRLRMVGTGMPGGSERALM